MTNKIPNTRQPDNRPYQICFMDTDTGITSSEQSKTTLTVREIIKKAIPNINAQLLSTARDRNRCNTSDFSNTLAKIKECKTQADLLRLVHNPRAQRRPSSYLRLHPNSKCSQENLRLIVIPLQKSKMALVICTYLSKHTQAANNALHTKCDQLAQILQNSDQLNQFFNQAHTYIDATEQHIKEDIQHHQQLHDAVAAQNPLTEQAISQVNLLNGAKCATECIGIAQNEDEKQKLYMDILNQYKKMNQTTGNKFIEWLKNPNATYTEDIDDKQRLHENCQFVLNMLDTKKETTSQDKMAEKSRQKQIDKDLIIKAFELLYKQKTSSLEENPQLQTKESEDSHLLTKITNAFDEIDKKENTTDGITIEEKQKVLIDAVKSDPSQQRLKQVNTGQKQPETSLEHTIDQLSKLHQVISKMNNDTFIAFENVLRCVKITSNGQNDMTITQDNLLTQIDAEIAKSQRPAKEPGRGSLRESLIDTVKSLRRAPLQQEQTKQEEATSSPEEATTQQTTKELPLGVKIPQAEK